MPSSVGMQTCTLPLVLPSNLGNYLGYKKSHIKFVRQNAFSYTSFSPIVEVCSLSWTLVFINGLTALFKIFEPLGNCWISYSSITKFFNQRLIVISWHFVQFTLKSTDALLFSRHHCKNRRTPKTQLLAILISTRSRCLPHHQL